MINMAIKIKNWVKVPVPYELTVFPSPLTKSGKIKILLKETFTFRTLLYGNNKIFWFFSVVFHFSLIVVLVGHILGIYFTGEHFTYLGLSGDESKLLSNFFGNLAGILLMISVLYLLLRRYFIHLIRIISVRSDYLILYLLIGIILTGNAMRFFNGVELIEVRNYIWGLAIYSMEPLPKNAWFLIHFTLVQMFLLYFPFSKLVHSCGYFFTQSLVKNQIERQVKEDDITTQQTADSISGKRLISN